MAIPLLCVLIFQTHMLNSWSSQASEAVNEATFKVNLWVSFKIARSAARYSALPSIKFCYKCLKLNYFRYGHHEIAHCIFKRLLGQVSTEHLYFWLQGLNNFSQAESLLSGSASLMSSTLMERLVMASKLYQEGLSVLKAATSPTCSLQFQYEFGRLRVDFLSACSQLVQACKTSQTAPAPAIAQAVAVATRDELQRCGRITHQLRKCVSDLKVVADAFAKLYQSSFDADKDSLVNLQLYTIYYIIII